MSTPVVIFMLVIAVLLAVAGILGAVMPALPGPPLSWVGLLLVYFACSNAVSLSLLLWMLCLTVVVTVLDYAAPAIMTHWGGGSKASTTGATIGTIVGLFFAPLGLIVGPLAGAFIGEWISQGQQPVPQDAPHGYRLGKSVKAALFSFMGFLLTTGIKLIATLWMAWEIVAAIWHYAA